MAKTCETLLIFLAMAEVVCIGSAKGVPEPEYVSACTHATAMSSVEEYDYIVVGGGTAGCPLAATLSQGFRVLLLERGGLAHTVPTIVHAEGFSGNLLAADDVASPAQSFTSEDGVVSYRGRVLGGSSSINAGFYSRAGAVFVREARWNKALVNESYRWVENTVVSQPVLKQWQGAFREGLMQAGVMPYNGFSLDHVEGTKVGGSIFDRRGRRHSAADLLLHANTDNLRIELYATVHRILFRRVAAGDGVRLLRPRAYGVEYHDINGVAHKAQLSANGGDVIISSGALGSPQLLLLSGVGPREHLASLGIPIVHHLPGVGQGMGDNPRNGIVLLSPQPLEYSLIQVVGITPGCFIEASSTSIPIPFHYDTLKVQKTSSLVPNFLSNTSPNATANPNQDPNPAGVNASSNSCRRAISIPHPNPVPFNANTATTPNRGLNKNSNPDTNQNPDSSLFHIRNAYFGTIIEKVEGPLSRGELRLRTVDVKDNPSVRFNYFSHPEDLRNCVKGLRIIDRALKSASLKAYTLAFTRAPLPADTRNDTAMEAFCRDTVATIWHYHGGCQVGTVVNRRYQVQGIDSLRVVDGSTFHRSPGTNPQATVMMLGRYMGLQILKERLPASIQDSTQNSSVLSTVKPQ